VLWAVGLVAVLLRPLAFPDWPSAGADRTSSNDVAGTEIRFGNGRRRSSAGPVSDVGRYGKMKGIRIAVSDAPAVLSFLARQQPNATAVMYKDKKDVDHVLASGLPDADRILMAAEEGAAWTILHPQFHLVTPSPTLLCPFGYAVACGDNKLLYYNIWLLNPRAMAPSTSFTDIRCSDVKQTLPPHWSVIRNIFGWTG
jgi:hypothetical protein